MTRTLSKNDPDNQRAEKYYRSIIWHVIGSTVQLVALAVFAKHIAPLFFIVSGAAAIGQSAYTFHQFFTNKFIAYEFDEEGKVKSLSLGI